MSEPQVVVDEGIVLQTVGDGLTVIDGIIEIVDELPSFPGQPPVPEEYQG